MSDTREGLGRTPGQPEPPAPALTDQELGVLTMRIQEALGHHQGAAVLLAISEGFQAAGNDQVLPGLGLHIEPNRRGYLVLDIAHEIRQLAARL